MRRRAAVAAALLLLIAREIPKMRAVCRMKNVSQLKVNNQ